MNSLNSSRPRVALFEPRIPQNTGTIGRSCLAFDMSLDIIKPTGFSFDDKYLKRAGLDYWPNVDLHLYESFEEYKDSFSNSRFIALTKKSNKSISNIIISCISKIFKKNWSRSSKFSCWYDDENQMD